MHPKVFVKLKKTLSSGPKNPKKPKKTHWAGFFLKNPGFFQPWNKYGRVGRVLHVGRTLKVHGNTRLKFFGSMFNFELYFVSYV